MTSTPSLRLRIKHSTVLAATAWVEGALEQPVDFVQQPDDVRVGLYGEAAQTSKWPQGMLDWTETDWNPPCLPSGLGNAWETFGSDHNTGLSWYGPLDAMTKVEAQLQSKILTRLQAMDNQEHTRDSYFSLPIWLSWTFEDSTRLIVVYTDPEYNGLGLEKVVDNAVISSVWGACTDDLMLQEFALGIARPLLVSQGFAIEADEDEDEEDEEEAFERFSIGARSIRRSDALVLPMVRHLFCDLMGWDRLDPNADESEEGPDPRCIQAAQALQAWQTRQEALVNLPRLSAPGTVVLGYTQGSSDKVYHIELFQDGVGFGVRSHNGRRGARLSTTLQTKTLLSLEQAAQAHQDLLRKQLKKGYTIES